MQKIIPHLWFDKEAAEAARWYVSLFENSGIIGTAVISDTPSGDAETVDFQLDGYKIAAISAGPYFKFNPSISLMVSCDTCDEVDRLHAALSSGGAELMPLGEYPFSKRYAWVQDRYGLNWQLILEDKKKEAERIKPVMLFAGDACGKADDAGQYYISVFEDARKSNFEYYAPDEAADARAKVKYGEISLVQNQFVLMDHGNGEDFTFNEAISFMVLCNDQNEIDHYWDKLSFVPEAEQCGWLKDRFGVSWQIVPADMNELLAKGTKDEVKRVTEAFLKMGKLDIAALKKVISD